nr:alpha/beta fold hydrolase [Murinocardiopsis flavida]
MSDVLQNDAFEAHPERRLLTTSDGVRIDSVLRRGARTRTTAVVLANGFTGTWRSADTKMIAGRMLAVGDAMTFDFRGHHDSTGECTVGDREVHDLEAVVAHLRTLGYTDIATVGFSMGAAVVIRHAAMFGGVRAVASVSGPSRWYYRGTSRMRLLHFGLETQVGRFFLRHARRVRVVDRHWDPVPPDPTESAVGVAPAALLVMHGAADTYFPVEHARRMYEAAAEPKDLWVEQGMGHAEHAMTPERADRLAAWIGRRFAAAREGGADQG